MELGGVERTASDAIFHQASQPLLPHSNGVSPKSVATVSIRDAAPNFYKVNLCRSKGDPLSIPVTSYEAHYWWGETVCATLRWWIWSPQGVGVKKFDVALGEWWRKLR